MLGPSSAESSHGPSMLGLSQLTRARKGGRLYRASRADKVWSLDDEANFLCKSPEHLRLPFLLALWTGQRQGDLLRLPWSAYDGTHIRLRQSKTGIRVVIPVGAPLKAALDAAARSKQGPLILISSEDRPWTPDGFRSSWRKACIAAGIVGLTFHDLRGTGLTRLASAGCTEAEIATLTGRALRDVRSILVPTTCIAIRRLPRVPSGSSKGEQKLPTVLECSGSGTRKGE
jgi:integrase